MSSIVNESQIEYGFVGKLADLKYTIRQDIRHRKALEENFRKKFEMLNRVHLSDTEFDRLQEEIINPDVFAASKLLRQRNTFIREDGTPLQYTLVNDYNLNIPRYVNNFKEEEEIDIHAVMKEIKTLEAKRSDLDKQIEVYLKELGLTN